MVPEQVPADVSTPQHGPINQWRSLALLVVGFVQKWNELQQLNYIFGVFRDFPGVTTEATWLAGVGETHGGFAVSAV